MRVFNCPKCEAPRPFKRHCESKTCVWAYCGECEHVTDMDYGRTARLKGQG